MRASVSAPSALPLYGPIRAVGRSREFGSVYVTDAIASADFNGDGLADVVYLTANSGSLSTFAMQFAVSDGPGRFVDGAERLFTGPVPRTQGGGRIVVADFNNDGRPDVYYGDSGAEVAPNPPGFHDTLVLSTPDGKLVDATGNIPRQSDFTHSAAAADVDGDGSIDLFVGNLGGNAGYSGNCCSIQLWLNDGAGHFRVASGLLPEDIVDGNRNSFTASSFADVNGDGRPDLLLGGSHGCTSGLAPRNDSQVLLNDGGRFHVLAGALPPKAFGVTTETLDIKPTDFNGDGRVDLVVASTNAPPHQGDCYSEGYVGRALQILVGNGDGTFRDETAARLPQDPHLESFDYIKNLTLADMDGDGQPDILTQTVVPPNGNAIGDAVYLNDGHGVFRPLSPASNPFASAHAHALVGGADGGRDVFLVEPDSKSDSWMSRRQISQPLPPGPPAETRASIDPATGDLVIAWPFVWGATSYEVWRSGTLIGSTRTTRFVDKTAAPATTYEYAVRAKNTSGRSVPGPTVTARKTA